MRTQHRAELSTELGSVRYAGLGSDRAPFLKAPSRC